jgi:hypothetical protein
MESKQISDKKAYKTPVVTEYGLLAEITQGQSTGACDGQAGASATGG